MSRPRLPWTWWVGARYLGARRDTRFVSFITGISMAGIALGVAVLVTVLSVMNGFERELRERILDVASHATLEGLEGTMDDWQARRAEVLARPGVTGAAPFVEGKGMLVAGQRSAGVELRGILPADEAQVSALGRHLREGKLEDLAPGAWRIVLGKALAAELNVKVGDPVLLVIAQGTVTPAGVAPRMRRFMVSGILDAGMYEYDRGLALLHLDDARKLYRMGDAVPGLRVALDDPFAAPQRIREVAVDLGGGFMVSDWTRRHANFFASIRITKSIMFVILSLVVGVAAFNIVSTLVMVVREKQGDIAILRTLGATPREVLAVFVVQGAAIGLVGTAVGLALGLLLTENLTSIVHGLGALLGTPLVDARVYFIDELPASLDWHDFLRVGGTACLLGVLSTIYPAWAAARTQPAEALRHDI